MIAGMAFRYEALQASGNNRLLDSSRLKGKPEFTNKLDNFSSQHDLLYCEDGTIYKVSKKGQIEVFLQADELTLITKGRLSSFSPPNGLSNHSEFWPSPNMDAIVFYATAENNSDSMQGLYLHELSSGKTVTLVPFEGLFQTPVFSPDGSKIAFYYSRDDDKSGWGGDWALNVINRDGTNRTELAPPSVLPAGNRFRVDWERTQPPIWSPDGEVIYFRANYGSGLYNYKVSLNNGTYEKLFLGMLSSISPDGEKLLGTYKELDMKDAMVCAWDTSGQNKKLLAKGMYPSISPDGELISFWRGDSLYIIDTEGKNERYLAVVPKKFTLPLRPATVIWGKNLKINTNQPISFSR